MSKAIEFLDSLLEDDVSLEIERPDWYEVSNHNISYDNPECEEFLNKWFNTYVEPINKMLSVGIEVYSKNAEFYETAWNHSAEDSTRKALLINIQPIKKETAEDVLRDLVFIWGNIPSLPESKEQLELYQRAKAVLGE